MSRNPRKDPSHPGHNSTGGALPGLCVMLENGRANGRRWRLSAGFLIQAALLALVVSLPLFHTEPLDAQAPPPDGPVIIVFAPQGTQGGTGHGPGGGPPPPVRPHLTTLSNEPILPIPGARPVNVGPAPDVGPGNGSGPAGPGTPDGSGIGVPGGTAPGGGPPPPVVVVGGKIQPPRLLVRVEPEYPLLAQRAGIEGDVLLEALLGTDGRVEQVRVVSGRPLLATSAQAAVEQWRYEPTTLNGRPVAVLLRVTVQFRLRR